MLKWLNENVGLVHIVMQSNGMVVKEAWRFTENNSIFQWFPIDEENQTVDGIPFEDFKALWPLMK